MRLIFSGINFYEFVGFIQISENFSTQNLSYSPIRENKSLLNFYISRLLGWLQVIKKK